MANTIFFAWQSDTPPERNKDFIWKALTAAVRGLGEDASPESCPRPEKDTTGVSGNPNIVNTIFERISACAIFIGDVTLVGDAKLGKKPMPNPNVMLELGFAAHSVGWQRTILVFNEASGRPEDLPFDIRQHRWPVRYKFTDETTVSERRLDQLIEDLQSAIKDCNDQILNRATRMASSLDMACLRFIARFESDEGVMPMVLPRWGTGEVVNSLYRDLATRRLLDLGALSVVFEPPSKVGYKWTYDGRRMIAQVHALHPKLLQALRLHFRDQDLSHGQLPSPSSLTAAPATKAPPG